MKIIYCTFFSSNFCKSEELSEDSPGVDACKLAVPNPEGCGSPAESKALFSNAEIGS